MLSPPPVIWNITWDPAEIGEVVWELCALDVGTPIAVSAEVPVDEVPEVGASEVVVSDVFPVVADPGVLIDEEPEVEGTEGVFVVVELLFDATVPAAGVPVDEELEVGTTEGVISDVVPVITAPE